MKNNFLICFLFVVISCQAQTAILPLYADNYEDVPGGYYKDIDNDLDNFVGIWEYVNGSTSLKITFQKKELYFDSLANNYYDMLVGEYRYVENGVEKINTLNLISNPPSDLIGHTIQGSSIIGNSNIPLCADCPPGTKRMSLFFSDPTRDEVEGLYGNLIIMRADQGTVQKIKAELRPRGNIFVTDDEQPQYTSFNVPWGDYILTKVP